MGFTTNDTAETDVPVSDHDQPEPATRPCEPAPEQVRDYIVDETDLTTEEVEDAATTPAEESRFLTELSAYYLVALDHGLQPAEVFETAQRSFSLDIDALHAEMKTVDLTAEIARITDINTFERDDGTEGQVCNVILQDGTGQAVLTLWDEDTALTAEVQSGDTVRIENGYSKVANDYCRDRLGCEVEVRIGDDSTLLRKSNGTYEQLKE